jgi:lipopolysaccharide transport system ATP-binding protein
LRYVSFEVKRGEVLGIIGRNGAGKSTLLKVLSRITEPTEGSIEIEGRIASLLEVGTGFHPELTGRENIYLNGAILGMTRAEIRSRFDKIVAFADIERFLDTPVKRYSSGMYVRLAFAVAAHLEAEILVVDEVLAVGDSEFQNKCLGKMRSVAKTEGRTVLFVSHNMAAISALCSKAFVLASGQLDTPPCSVEKAVQSYFVQLSGSKMKLSDRKDRQGERNIRITHFAAVDRHGNEREFLFCGEYVELRLYYEANGVAELRNVAGGIGITAFSGAHMSELSNKIAAREFKSVRPKGYICCAVEKLPLAPGSYSVNLILRQNDIIQDWVKEAAVIIVEPGDFFGNGKMPTPGRGGFLIEQKWSFKTE